MYFIKVMFGLVPQSVKPEYQYLVETLIADCSFDEILCEYFEPFEKTKNITWQQYKILLAVEAAIKKLAPSKISVSSGNGVGKSTTMSWILIWYLYCFPLAQIPCTAPSREQMFDVLWKECSKWIGALPEPHKSKFDVQTAYIRIVDRPKEWWARAKTAKRDSPEALSGVHGEYIMFLIDEASGVDDVIYEMGMGSLTGENYLMIMISNPTRLSGYFYDSHHKNKHRFQTLVLNAEESPVVTEQSLAEKLEDAHGDKNADYYRTHVTGQFPNEEGLDEKGFTALFKKYEQIADEQFVGAVKMGIDPAGEGEDETEWVIRDKFKAKLVLTEKISNSKSIAKATLVLMEMFGISKEQGESIYVDNFGVGANVAQELMAAGVRVNGVNVGDKPEDDERYANKKAECYWAALEWVSRGGNFIQNKKWEQLKTIKYTRTLKGKLKIMTKDEMRRAGIKSPNAVEAFMLTFWDNNDYDEVRPQVIHRKTNSNLNSAI